MTAIGGWDSVSGVEGGLLFLSINRKLRVVILSGTSGPSVKKEKNRTRLIGTQVLCVFLC